MILTENDLDFLVDTVSPEVTDRHRLKQIIQHDTDFRSTFVGSEKVFNRVMDDEEIFLKVSPRLFFEVLLRRACSDLEKRPYTLEKTKTMRIPVFDSKDVVEILTKESLVIYLADMLSSFTKIESYSMSFRVRKGVWKKIHFNDLDLESLLNMAEKVEDPYRFGFYKRIADVCLFVLGIFPGHAEREYRYPSSGELRAPIPSRMRISPEEYEKEGRRFYKLAAEHHAARELELSDTFMTLHGHFEKAKKPLNMIAERYLPYKRYVLL
jgi:hypothetical protein